MCTLNVWYTKICTVLKFILRAVKRQVFCTVYVIPECTVYIGLWPLQQLYWTHQFSTILFCNCVFVDVGETLTLHRFLGFSFLIVSFCWCRWNVALFMKVQISVMCAFSLCVTTTFLSFWGRCLEQATFGMLGSPFSMIGALKMVSAFFPCFKKKKKKKKIF